MKNPPKLSIIQSGADFISMSIKSEYQSVESYTVTRSSHPDLSDPIITIITGSNDFVYTDSPVSPGRYYYTAKQTVAGETSGYSNLVVGEVVSWGVKYQIFFNDVLGKNFRIDFRFRTYNGVITQLIGDESPLIISSEGDESEPMDPIRQTKATINILMPDFSDDLYNDLSKGTDKECWIEVLSGNEVVCSGWMLPDHLQRTFSTYIYQISVLVASPFSIMKGEQLLDNEGRMLFNKVSLKTIIETALSRSIPSIVTPVYEIYSTYSEEMSDGSTDLFEDVGIIMEGFNDDGGKPPRCYDMLEKIMLSFGFYSVWENNILKIIDPYNIADRGSKNIVIKNNESSIGSDFLVGNTESITQLYASKEISYSYDYGKATGLLRNGRFMIYDQSTGKFSFWTYADAEDSNGNIVRQYNSTTVVRNGSGRPIDPYVMRMIGDGGSQVSSITSDEPINQGLFDDAYFKAGDFVNLSIKYKYRDYKSELGINASDSRIPWLVVFVIFQDADINNPGGWPYLKFAIDVKDLEYTTKSDEWQRVDAYKDLSFPAIVFAPQAPGPTYLPPKLFIGIDSNEDIQTYSQTLGKMPFNGYVTIQIMGAVWEDGQPVPIPQELQYVDILEVILSKSTIANGTQVTGEKTYLTQFGDYSQVEDTKETYIGNFSNDGITGCLFKSDGNISGGIKRNPSSVLTLQDWLLSSKMALRRNPRHRADVDIRSNTMKMTDVLEFKEGENNLLPNKYMIMRMNYDVKQSEVAITAYQTNPEYKPFRNRQVPDWNNDMWENFKTTPSTPGST